MHKQLTSVIMCLPFAAAAQFGSKVPIDKGFIDNTIEYYYAVQAKKHSGPVLFFIQKDSLTTNAKTDYGTFKVQFVSADDALSKMPEAGKGGAKLDHLQIKWLSLDTIDVVIVGCTVGQRKKKQVVNKRTVMKTENFLTDCTDAFVDVPTCRFIYDRTNSKWSQLNRGKDLK